EAPSGNWVEETAQDLAVGTKPGWFLPPAEGGGIAFFTQQGREAYGHVHAGEGAAASDAAYRLATALLDGLPSDVRSANLGFTGLDGDAELAFAARLAERPGSTVIERLSMERDLVPADGAATVTPPAGMRLLPVREITVEALADLDRRAFEGTVDELLVGPSQDAYRLIFESILEGRLGRFVDEASVALLERDPIRLVGLVLTTEQSIRRSVLVDLMVDPERRRRGLGHFLLTWALRAHRALGYDSVRLWVTAANGPARALYATFDFRTIGRATIYRWDRPGTSPHPHASR
ncbi:MAG TPA: GNAT family N-acetyltransferase, partial [Thermoplasmata archaeon]|nr:GNAT family N-acetyltransferase [Thermoplasmata archaeon]